MILLRNAEHLGYTRSVNAAVAWALDNTEVADLWIVNDDVLLLRGLPEIADAPADAGLIGVLSNRAGYQSLTYSLDDIGDYLYPDIDNDVAAQHFDFHCHERGTRFIPVPLVHGFCFRASRGCLQAIGLLDNRRFLSGYGSDYDLSLRAVRAGFTNYVYTGCFVAHVGSASAGRVKRRMLTILADHELRRSYGEQYQRAKFVTRQRLDRHLANYFRLTRD
jgi:GT2 family glycosyltransferase